MKKIIIVSVLLVSILGAPVMVKAQVAPVEITEQELRIELINLIKQMIVILQAQLEQMVAQQNSLNQIAQNGMAAHGKADDVPPVVSLNKISREVSGTLYIRSDIARDQGGKWLDKLEFFVDGELYASLSYDGGTNQLGIDTTKFTNGKHLLSVKAYDLAGNTGNDSTEIEVAN